MTKPQGLFVAPVVALALWNANGGRGRRDRIVAAAAGAAITAAILVAPLVLAGTTIFMLRSVAVLAGHDALSALAFNLWWLIGGLLRRAPAIEVMTHAPAMARGFPNPRIVGLLIAGAAVVWALATARRARDLGLHAALAAFLVDLYFTLSVQVHENHFFLAVPLLALAAALRREFAPVLAAVSVIWALNLYVVYGVHGEGAIDLARVTRIDPTVLLALANCAVCGWFCVVVAGACRVTAPETAAAAGA